MSDLKQYGLASYLTEELKRDATIDVEAELIRAAMVELEEKIPRELRFRFVMQVERERLEREWEPNGWWDRFLVRLHLRKRKVSVIWEYRFTATPRKWLLGGGYMDGEE